MNDKSLYSYKEDTNVFSYYIANASLFISGEFIPWLVNQKNGIKFKLTNTTLNSYIKMLNRALNSKYFSDFCDNVTPDKNFGMRMSIVELK